VDPPEVVLKGGEGELGDRREVKTYPVTLSRRTTDQEERMGLDLEGLHLVEVSPSAIWVRVKIAPTLLERAMKEVPVRSIPQGRSASIKPDKVEVLLKGPMDIIDTIKERDIEVVVDLEGLAPGVHHVAPKVTAPKGLRVLKVVPPILEVALDAQPDSSDG
jgi:YbbR domain-containing protein